MNTVFNKFVYVLGLCLMPLVSQSAILNFNFTGRLIVADQYGNIVLGNDDTFTPISASLTYDTATGFGDSSISTNVPILDALATFHDISMTRQGNTNLITGQILVDWNGNNNMLLHVEWDATGLFNAINYGLQAGDVLSGSDLYRDANENGVQDEGEFLVDISSATPHSDSLQFLVFGNNVHLPGGPAPMAATSGSMGFDSTTPFPGFRGYFDIGTGNSMYVTSVSVYPFLLPSGSLALA